ncbi:PP2C family serine/threonine-protein phosphatase [Suttonella ornithocola]|uniref:PPM-type phosphatase domain-containing protein n=1 Tax=Suttonella ornithocola TaxID=279832 RepID=A0A380MNX4_9GAMM|nr:PP2C family serine/threonine-protein phosphatase [Suttonella ornithocola]SUO94320.1 Uncharacterised protein [Suttonella ornithocola]
MTDPKHPPNEASAIPDDASLSDENKLLPVDEKSPTSDTSIERCSDERENANLSESDSENKSLPMEEHSDGLATSLDNEQSSNHKQPLDALNNETSSTDQVSTPPNKVSPAEVDVFPASTTADLDKIIDGGTIRLPNAKQNQPYCETLPASKIHDLTALQLSEDTDVELTLEENILKGTPQKAGEYQLSLIGKRGKERIQITLQLLINPDPRTLWQEIEPETPLFRKSHRAYLRQSTPQATLTAARIRGRSHAHKGSFCEDDIAILSSPNTLGYFGMVADGAGSSRYSRLASQVLCESVPRHLQKNFHALQQKENFAELLAPIEENKIETNLRTALSTCLAHSVYYALNDLQAHCQLNGESIPITFRDLYSTCLCFWALPLADGSYILTSYWVGDGGLAVAHDNTFTLLGEPDGGEFSGQTRFLTVEEVSEAAFKKRIRCARYTNLQSVWALTDGITDAKFASESQLNQPEQWRALANEILPHLADEKALYDWLGFWSQGNHDDRSLCVLEIHHKECTDD